MDCMLDELCSISDCLSNQMPEAKSSTHKMALRSKFQYLLHKIVVLYDELMSDNTLHDGDVSSHAEGGSLQAERSTCKDEIVNQSSQAAASKHLSFKTPVPKGRLLEIIASLQRASEGQCSNQTELQDQCTEQEIQSPLPPSQPATHTVSTSTATSTSSQVHSHSSTITESANESNEGHASSSTVENDVAIFDSHQEIQRSTEYSLSLAHAQHIEDTILPETPPIESNPPPLAPPPPPLAPPPPPPVSAPGLITTAQRVMQYEPTVPMKPLFWKKLQYSGLEVRGQDIVWTNTSEPVLEEMTEFEKLFQRKSQAVKTTETSSHISRQHNSSQPIRLLDGQRSQAIAIVMKSLHVDLDEITQAIVAMETGLVDVDSLKALNEMKATDEELCKIKSHLQGDSKQPLDKPEMFLYQLSLIPNFPQRLNCLLFNYTFAESASSMTHKLSTLQKACHSLRHSKPLHDVLALILALGNVMNSSSKVRGQADGFRLSVLPQLMDIKATQTTPTAVQAPPTVTTLLHFIVSYFVKYKCAGLTTFPLPDPSAVLAASQIQFDELYSELELLTRQLGVAKTDLAIIIEDTSTPHSKMVKNRMQRFLSQSAVRLKELSVHLSDAEKQFESTVSYFCVETPCGEGRVSPAHFFGLWSPFLREFQRLWTIEMKNRAIARQKAAQQERWAGVVVKPVSQTGLKSRLKLLHSSNTPS